MKKYNVVNPKKYEKDGKEKTVWLNVGTMTEFDNGNKVLELNMFPDIQYCIFARDAKEESKDGAPMESRPVREEIKPEDIPF